MGEFMGTEKIEGVRTQLLRDEQQEKITDIINGGI